MSQPFRFEPWLIRPAREASEGKMLAINPVKDGVDIYARPMSDVNTQENMQSLYHSMTHIYEGLDAHAPNLHNTMRLEKL